MPKEKPISCHRDGERREEEFASGDALCDKVHGSRVSRLHERFVKPV